jgi:hypothetical protein
MAETLDQLALTSSLRPAHKGLRKCFPSVQAVAEAAVFTRACKKGLGFAS